MSDAQQSTTTTLSALLREVSLRGHRPEEGGSAPAPEEEPRYATAFLRGGLNRAGIAAQFAQHFLMYEALEAATDAQIALRGRDFAFAMPELRRLPSLRSDLEFWLGDDWETAVRGTYSTSGIIEYRDRIAEVAGSSLPHFIAHHYTRYLADLSGGLMIAKMFRRSYDIEGPDGVRFYIFDEIPDPKAFKERYRGLLDTLPFDEEGKRVCADEVGLGYRLNNLAGDDLEERATEYLS